MKLDGKNAIVTGGGSGIGLATAVAMSAEGARVLITGRRKNRLREAVENFSGPHSPLVHPADVADRSSVSALIEYADAELGQIDILVNAAGINVPNRAIGELTPDDWDRMLQVNATGTYNVIHAVLPQMRKRRNGLIVNVSSIAGKRGDLRGGAGYTASKFAQSGLGMTLGAELGAEGIRVSNIYPGETNTPILDDRPVVPSDEHRASILQPGDVAAAILMVACLPPRTHVPELIITPTWQPYV